MSKDKYIVVLDRPYNEEVHYFDIAEEAIQKVRDLERENLKYKNSHMRGVTVTCSQIITMRKL